MMLGKILKNIPVTMKTKKEVKPKKKSYVLAQILVAGTIFTLFLLGIFVLSTYDLIVFLIPLIVINLIFGIINRTKGLRINLTLLSLMPVLPFFLIEYIASLVGVGFSFLNFLRVIFLLKKV